MIKRYATIIAPMTIPTIRLSLIEGFTIFKITSSIRETINDDITESTTYKI